MFACDVSPLLSSTPLFVGAWAHLLAGHPNLGFAAPHLYALPATDFNDVVSGNNGAYSAAAGFDYVTGRGSFMLNLLNQDIGSY